MENAMSDLSSIAYISRSRLSGDLAEQLAGLVRRASERNAQSGLTGALICSPGYFAQVLEGPADALEETFERIQIDPRHSEVEVLYLTAITERQFGNWGMASAGVLDDDGAIDDVLGRLDAAARVQEPDAVGRDAMALLTKVLLDRELH